MKKQWMKFCLAVFLMVTSACVGQNSEPDKEAHWAIVDEETLSQEAADALNQAVENLDEMHYEPVKLLAKQREDETDYAILCQIKQNVSASYSMYGIVYISVNENGEAQLRRVETFGDDPDSQLDGGWSSAVQEDLILSARSALETAAEELTGASYETEALMAVQIVGGINYLILCKVTTITAEPSVTYRLVTLYDDLEGDVSISSQRELVFSLR